MDKLVATHSDGITYADYAENMDEKMVDIYLSELTAIIEASEKPLRILTDTSRMRGIMESRLRQKIAERIKQFANKVYKSALVGLNNEFKEGAATIVLAMSERRDVKVFQDREAAIRWLKE